MNLIDAIWRNSFAMPQRVALLCDGQSISYAALRQMSEVVASRLVVAGVKRGDCIAIAVQHPLSYFMLTLAAAYIGAICTPVQAGDPEPVKQALLTRHDARWLVHDQSYLTPGNLPASARLDVRQLLAPPEPGARIKRAPFAHDASEDVWIYALSSGTTGTPKTIPHTHRRSMLLCSLAAPPLEGRQAISMVYMPMSVYVGLIYVLRVLFGGGTAVITGLADPAKFFETVERDKPGFISTSTGRAMALAYAAATSVPDSRAKCASVEVIALAGAAVPPALGEAVAQRICPNIVVDYGATEAGLIARVTPQTWTDRPESAGRLHQHAEAQSMDEHDSPLPIGKLGVLRFRTPTQASGYLHDAEASAQAFRDGWFYPGDLGYVDQAGYLILAGRVDHLINIGGDKIDPVQIEKTLDSHPAVMESAVLSKETGAAGGSALVAVVVLRAEVQKSELQEWCRERLGPKRVPGLVIFTESLPKSAAGKLMRKKLADSVEVKPAELPPDANRQ